MPNVILKRFPVHSGRSSGIGFTSPFDVWLNTAKKNRSNATIGVISSDIWCFCTFDIFWSRRWKWKTEFESMRSKIENDITNEHASTVDIGQLRHLDDLQLNKWLRMKVVCVSKIKERQRENEIKKIFLEKKIFFPFAHTDHLLSQPFN